MATVDPMILTEGGEVCDMGCGPGHVSRYLHDAGATVSGLDLSPRMVEIARQLNPDLSFLLGNMACAEVHRRACVHIRRLIDRSFRESFVRCRRSCSSLRGPQEPSWDF
jgi:SAM-dependent methyltransferase